MRLFLAQHLKSPHIESSVKSHIDSPTKPNTKPHIESPSESRTKPQTLLRYLSPLFLAFLTSLTLGISTPSASFGLESPFRGTWNFHGNANLWGLYQKDDFASTTVALVYSESGNLLGVAVGPDIAKECVSPRTCEYRKLGSGDGNSSELVLGRTISSTDAEGRTTQDKGPLGGDTLLQNLGARIEGSSGYWSTKLNGNLTFSLMDQRALYGKQRVRPRFSDLYFQFKNNQGLLSLGRRSLTGPAQVDGAYAEWFFGPGEARDAKAIGFFAGTSPDPLSSYPNMDYITLGPTFRFIPDFSSTSDTKLFVDGAWVTEFYKGNWSRFYLYTKAHFTPIKSLSFLGISTLDLPAPQGDQDTEIKSSHLSLQTFWRPNSQWFFSVGLSQFRIERFLEQSAVQWVVDDGSTQILRVSDSLDRSHRYRFDLRAAYKPLSIVQPFVRFRYERRTIDSNKTYVNTPLDSASTPATETNLSLVGKKTAQRTSAGLRFFLFDDRLLTETIGTLNQRFKSSGWDAFQSVTWEHSSIWSADVYAQYVSSKRDLDYSDPASGSAAARDQSEDFYAGIGGTYKFKSDLLAQIRYDFSYEDDRALDSRILSHTLLGRIDYHF